MSGSNDSTNNPGSPGRMRLESNQGAVPPQAIEKIGSTATKAGEMLWDIPGLSQTLFVDIDSRAETLARLVREKKATPKDFKAVAEPALKLFAKLDDFPAATHLHVNAAYKLFRALADAFVIEDVNRSKPPILAKEDDIRARATKAQEKTEPTAADYLARSELRTHHPEMAPLAAMHADYVAVAGTSEQSLRNELDLAVSEGYFDDQQVAFLLSMFKAVTNEITLEDLRVMLINFIRHKEHDLHMASWIFMGKEDGTKPGSGEIKKFVTATQHGYCGPTIERSHTHLPKTAAKIWGVVEETANSGALVSQHVAGGGPQHRFPPIAAAKVMPFFQPRVWGAGKRAEMFDPESAEKFQWHVESKITAPDGTPYMVNGVPLMVYSDMTQLAEGVLMLLRDTYAIRRAVEGFRRNSHTTGVVSRRRTRRVKGGAFEEDPNPESLDASAMMAALSQQAIPAQQVPALPALPASDAALKSATTRHASSATPARRSVSSSRRSRASATSRP